MAKKYAKKIKIEKIPERVKHKILIVDDSKATRYLINFTLQRFGFQIIEAADGEEAIEKAIDEIPELIILDIAMPKLDGFMVTQKLRKDEITKDIPIIIISGLGRYKEMFEFTSRTMVNGFLEKPFTTKTLIDKVKEILPFR